MTDTFDAVLAEMLAVAENEGCATDWRIRHWRDCLSAAHAAELDALHEQMDVTLQAWSAEKSRAEAAERDAMELRDELETLLNVIEGHPVALPIEAQAAQARVAIATTEQAGT